MSKLTGRHVGFVSTRFAGTDGVSLESAKWSEVLERMGHTCFYFSGYSNRPTARSMVVPEAFFGHESIDAISATAFENQWGAHDLLEFANPDIVTIHNEAFSHHIRPPRLSEQIKQIQAHLKSQLYGFVKRFTLDLLIIENAITIPMNIPLGLAITEFIAETGFPVIAHHHDFYWERQRFLVNCVSDYLSAAFPPTLPSIRHVVINSVAARQLSLRTGNTSMLIPNVMDFTNPPPALDDYAVDARGSLGIAADEVLFLQPTRIVQRKGIEHAIELVQRLEMKARLFISHASGDEGDDYERRVRQFAALLNVPVTFEAERVQEKRGLTADGKKIFTLGDLYPHADVVTYPSAIEGFGNAFLEAVYYRRPLVVNNYSIFDMDIRPKGFRVIGFDGFITDSTVRQTRRIIADAALAGEMAEVNYRLARRHFSYEALERRLQTLVADCFGEG